MDGHHPNWLDAIADSIQNLANITQNSAESWPIYLQGIQKLYQLWLETGETGDFFQPFTSFEQDNTKNPENLLNDQWFEDLLQSPSLGLNREFINKLRQSLEAWLQLSQSNLRYQMMLTDVWYQAFGELMQELAHPAKAGKTPQNWQQVMNLWSCIFDRIFAEKFQDEEAVEIKGNYINASLKYRQQQQQLMDIFLTLNDLPTRREVDELHQNIYELRKEIKQLKKTFKKSKDFKKSKK